MRHLMSANFLKIQDICKKIGTLAEDKDSLGQWEYFSESITIFRKLRHFWNVNINLEKGLV